MLLLFESVDEEVLLLMGRFHFLHPSVLQIIQTCHLLPFLLNLQLHLIPNLLQVVLIYGDTETDDLDVRDRAYIYWQLLLTVLRSWLHRR
nr:hypothetical protein [Tanacetum cinerariifolium]